MNKISYGIGFLLVLLGTLWLYWASLHSIFILDDEPNLQGLANITDSDPLTGMGKFVTEGIASQLGRPLSLLSFALQYHRWPLEPWHFKYVNLMIHLLNGCLVFWLILALAQLLNLPSPLTLKWALLTTTLWLMHPLQVSTVLYTIQRMTELSALFTLGGLLLYLKGRAQQRLFPLASLGVVGGGILATLSKETGVLLVFYIWVLETTLLHSLPRPPYWQIWWNFFIYLPITLLTVYLAVNFTTFLQVYQIRDFTMGERLLTETRVLSDYLAKILLLRPDHFSLFQDDYPISHHLLMPPTTLWALLMLVLMLVLALRVRHTLPMLALAILWFLAGHLLESSFIGLVPYFEHRNYLPMLGILLAGVWGMLKLLERMPTVNLRRIVAFLSMTGILLFPTLTWMQTSLWAKPVEQAEFWAEKQPFSRFAQSHAATIFEKLEQPAKVAEYYRHMVKAFPEDTGPYLLWFSLACRYPHMTPPKPEAFSRFQKGRVDTATLTGLNFILDERIKGNCNLDSRTLEEILNILIRNGHFYQSYLHHLAAIFYAQERRYQLAIQHAEQSLALADQLSLRIQQIQWLIADHRLPEAQAYLQKTLSSSNYIEKNLYQKELNSLAIFIKKPSP